MRTNEAARARLHAVGTARRDVHCGDHLCHGLRHHQPGGEEPRRRWRISRSACWSCRPPCAPWSRISCSWRNGRCATRWAEPISRALVANVNSTSGSLGSSSSSSSNSNGTRGLGSSSGAQPLVALTRAGWTNPNGLQRPGCSASPYYFQDGTLRREYWTVLDPTQSSQAVRRDLMTHLKSVSLRFMDVQSGNVKQLGMPDVRFQHLRRRHQLEPDLAAHQQRRSEQPALPPARGRNHAGDRGLGQDRPLRRDRRMTRVLPRRRRDFPVRPHGSAELRCWSRFCWSLLALSSRRILPTAAPCRRVAQRRRCRLMRLCSWGRVRKHCRLTV